MTTETQLPDWPSIREIDAAVERVKLERRWTPEVCEFLFAAMYVVADPFCDFVGSVLMFPPWGFKAYQEADGYYERHMALIAELQADPDLMERVRRLGRGEPDYDAPVTWVVVPPDRAA